MMMQVWTMVKWVLMSKVVAPAAQTTATARQIAGSALALRQPLRPWGLRAQGAADGRPTSRLFALRTST